MEKGLMILTTSCFDTIRFIPALVVSEAEMNEAIEIFSAAIEEIAREGYSPSQPDTQKSIGERAATD
jgi:4-aminobutyrate aminotransferase